MFTWAYNQLSKSWERALTDTSGEYAELMASSYSLDQPDFTWLMPYESKEFSQLWYPVGDIGTPLCACREAAIAVGQGALKCQVTLPLKDACLFINDEKHVFSAGPDQICTIPLPEELCSFRLVNASGQTLLSYEKTSDNTAWQMPETLPDNPTLDKLKNAQELYLLGVHAAQYRDPVTRPAGYWREALRRDPEHLPTLIALAGDELSHFRPENAWELAQRAWKVATVRNFHPESGELQYIRGRILEALDRPQEALDEYLQAAWAQDARSRAMTRAALLELRMNMNDKALEHAEEALRQHAHNETAMLARIIALRRIASPLATQALADANAFDSLNLTLRALTYGVTPALYNTLQSDPCQSVLDMAQELYEMGENALAADILSGLSEKCAQSEYVRWFLCGDEAALDAAACLSPGIAYPLREVEYRALKAVLSIRPQDANAMDLLACLQYHTGNYEKADNLWSSAIVAAPGNYKPHRNLAVARYSHTGRREEALPLLDKALSLYPKDGQLQWEKAYLMTRLRANPDDTVTFIKKCGYGREDMAIELCRALNLSRRYSEAIEVLTNKHFTPCEGGEHAVAEQYMFAHHALGREYLQVGRIEKALHHFQAAQQLPDNLGTGLWHEVILTPHQYFEALCQRKLHHEEKASALFSHILALKVDYFTNVHLPDLPCWQAMVLQQTGRDPQAREILAAHLRRQEQALNARDAGNFKTTPFFISYMEPATQQRQAACDWQIAMAHWASGDYDAAAFFARRSLEAEPANLYATLLTHKL